MMCYEKSCRLCLKELSGPGIDCSTISELRETISKMFEVQINRSDTIKCICNKCFEHVMGFRAFKKTIAECQKIIIDYETIKKKVLETRIITSIKQEVIDVDDPDIEMMVDRNKRKRPGPTSVTDSQINDILAIVHDKSATNSRVLKVSSTSLAKKSRNVPIMPVTVKIEPELLSPQVDENRGRSTEPISSTSRDLAEKLPRTDSDKLCSDSIDSSSKHLNNPQTSPTQRQSTSASSPTSIDTTAEAVSSSVQTPTENRNKSDNRPQGSGSLTRTSISVTPPTQLNESNLSIENGISKNGTLDKTGGIINCPICSTKLRTEKELEIHLQKHHKTSKAIIEKTEPSKIKELENVVKEEISISSSEEDKVPVRGRATRRAKSQAMKKFALSPTGTSTSPSLRRSARAIKASETPNNSLTGPQQTSTPIAAATKNISKNNTKPESTQPDLNNTTSTKDESLKKSNEKKRIITITLVRTKESLNFRYCDQFKQSIDFGSVSADELEDIRKSLMIPEIWANLKNVFKVSPPDERTIEELKTIFGDKFNI